MSSTDRYGNKHYNGDDAILVGDTYVTPAEAAEYAAAEDEALRALGADDPDGLGENAPCEHCGEPRYRVESPTGGAPRYTHLGSDADACPWGRRDG
jgi:hypothetical protein